MGILLNVDLHMQITDTFDRSVNCKYKAATEDIFTFPVKAGTIMWSTSECMLLALREYIDRLQVITS
jgi:hypothetical protein